MELQHDPWALTQLAEIAAKPSMPVTDSPISTSGAAPTGQPIPFQGYGDAPRKEINDEENGRVFKEMYGDRVKFVTKKKTWIIWKKTKGVWEWDEKNEAIKLTWKVTDEVEKRVRAMQYTDPKAREADIKAIAAMRNVSKMKSLLQVAETQCAIDVEELDSHPYLLNCKNGVVDLVNGELIPHDEKERTRGFLLTKQIPINYVEGARSEEWENFLNVALQSDQELITFVQRAVGYTLGGDPKEESLFFVHGPTGTGKSTFIEAVSKVLADYHTTARFESFLQSRQRTGGGPSEDMVRLLGARMVSAQETNEGRRMDVGLVKTLTGRDRITARDLYEKSISFYPQFSLWLIANDPPIVPDTDDAIWRRMKEIPFIYAVPPEQRDTGLKDRLKDLERNGEGILAWAVRGCMDWQKNSLPIPEAVRIATEKYKIQMDPLTEFLEETYVIHPNAKVPAQSLYPAYTEWVDAQPYMEKKVQTKPKFEKRLKDRGFKLEEINGTLYYLGLGLKSEAHEPPSPQGKLEPEF